MSINPDRLHVTYTDVGGWRWQLRARNGEVVAATTEAYGSKGAVLANIARLHAVEVNDGRIVVSGPWANDVIDACADAVL